MNCAGIPPRLAGGELIRHERCAFAGAITQGLGPLEMAGNRAVLIDESGDIPLALQPKLLRSIDALLWTGCIQLASNARDCAMPVRSYLPHEHLNYCR
ncbi:MAG: sigma 54-interacting transcriptional regulator [Bryobacteraceae bacterium]